MQIFFVVNGQRLTNNLAIWSHRSSHIVERQGRDWSRCHKQISK